MLERSQYADKVKTWLGKPIIKVLCGMRRVGKSTLLSLLKDEFLAKGVPAQNMLHMNMELMENAEYATAETLHRQVKSYFKQGNLENVLLIDEVQEVDGWERVVNSLHAEQWCDIILTGSNARLFSGELATLLTGRYIQISVFALSFAEFLRFRGIPTGVPIGSIEAVFFLWLRWGGMPGLHHIDFAGKSADEAVLGTEYLRSVLDTIVLKDVVMRQKIRDPAFLTLLIRFAFDNIGKLFSAKSISDWLKARKQSVSIETVQNYVRFLEDAQLIYSLPQADLQGKRLLAYNEKLYIGDLGLRHALLGYRADDIGSLLENVVLIELFRRRYVVQVGRLGSKEIDFVADRGGEKLYVQVSYLLAGPETIEREFSALEAVKDNFPKIVLSMDRSPFAGRNGILHRYLPEWLLAGEEVHAGRSLNNVNSG